LSSDDTESASDSESGHGRSTSDKEYSEHSEGSDGRSGDDDEDFEHDVNIVFKINAMKVCNA
jgi:hypothetical protein